VVDIDDVELDRNDEEGNDEEFLLSIECLL